MRWMAMMLGAGCTSASVAPATRPPAEAAPIDLPDLVPADTGARDTDVDRYESASLRIVSPKSGAYFTTDDPQRFEAEWVDGAGAPIDAAVTWSSDVDSSWNPVGLVVTDSPLGPGRHDVTASAVLPTGARHRYTIGGVHVQSAYAGTYEVELDYWRAPTRCEPRTVEAVVGPETGQLTASSFCWMDGGPADIMIHVELDLTVDTDGVLSGLVGAGLWAGPTPTLPAEGEIDDLGAISIRFGDAAEGGTLDGMFVSPSVP